MGKLEPEVERQLRQSWFQNVNELADIGLQRRSWLDPLVRNPHWSYVEFCESFPRSDQLDDARDGGWLSRAEHGILRELCRVVEAHAPPGANNHDHAAILADPAWHSVVEVARQARQQLLAIVPDCDKAALSTPVTHEDYR